MKYLANSAWEHKKIKGTLKVPFKMEFNFMYLLTMLQAALRFPRALYLT